MWRSSQLPLARGDQWGAYSSTVDIPATIEALRVPRCLDASLFASEGVVFARRLNQSFVAFAVDEALLLKLLDREAELARLLE
jgi:hypothetical protein